MEDSAQAIAFNIASNPSAPVRSQVKRVCWLSEVLGIKAENLLAGNSKGA
jgi:hypothetical protein